MDIANKLNTIADNMTRVYEAGKNLVIPFERYVTSLTFNDLNFFDKENVVLDLDNANSLAYFYNSKTANRIVKHITINCPNKISSVRTAFRGINIYDETLEHITLNVDTSECGWWTEAFGRMYALKIIDGTPLNPIKVNGNGFSSFIQNCPKLEEIYFAEKSILKNINFSSTSNLKEKSVQSIIDGLADLTGQTAKTLTVHSTVGEKLTEEQKATITAKNWILAY